MTNNFENHEHENNDEFIDHDIAAHDEHVAPRGVGGKLTEAWRTRPMVKFIVLIIAVFAVFVAGFSFFGGNSSNELSHLGRPPALHEAPGGVVSPYMREQTELANKERADTALATGGSAIQTPIGQNAGVGDLAPTDKKEDPLNELRAETERLKQQVQQQQVTQQQQQRQPAEPFDDSLAQAMQRQMQQLLESWKPAGIKQVKVSEPEDPSKQDAKNGKGAFGATGNDGGATETAKIVVNAGTVSYGQLLTEANSDVPGPILAQIVSGPLAGARAVGSFQVSAGYEKYLVLSFNLADKKGKDYAINAIALDPNTTLGGMATEVDERYFVRVVLPAAAGFLQGVGQAVGEGGSSITTNGSVTSTTIASNGIHQGIYNGLGQAAQTMGQFFQNQANLTKPLVRVAAGTPIGLFFVAPVTEPTGNGAVTAAAATTPVGAIGVGNSGVGGGFNTVGGYGGQQPPYGGNSYGSANATGAPYPNYAVPGYGYSGSLINRNPVPSAGNGFSTIYNQGYTQ